MNDHPPVEMYYGKDSPISPAYSSVTTRPDWVIVGSPHGGQNGEVILIASKKLLSGSLILETDTENLSVSDVFSPIARMIVHREYRLEITMAPDGNGQVFVMITAPTYGQALKALLRHWRPSDEEEGDEDEGGDDRPALDTGPTD